MIRGLGIGGKPFRDWVLIVLVAVNPFIAMYFSRDRITGTEHNEEIQRRNAKNIIRDEWRNAMTVAICADKSNPALCERNWSAEIKAADE